MIFNFQPWDKRRCTICGGKLSIHNHKDICFHHKQHEDYDPHLVITSRATSYTNQGRYFAIIDYYGYYKDD